MITEDSNSGFQFFHSICEKGGRIKSGVIEDSNTYNKAKEIITMPKIKPISDLRNYTDVFIGLSK